MLNDSQDPVISKRLREAALAGAHGSARRKSLWDMNADELSLELKSCEMRVREINRLLRKRHKEDFEHFKLDQVGNPTRIRMTPNSVLDIKKPDSTNPNDLDKET